MIEYIAVRGPAIPNNSTLLPDGEKALIIFPYSNLWILTRTYKPEISLANSF